MLLVVIIIFMVITPLTPKGLQALVPQPPPPNEKAPPPDLEKKTIVVQVLENHILKINEDVADWNTLGPRLNDIFKLRAEKVAFVKGDDTVVFADVARAIDTMRANGVEKVGLITARLEAGQ